MPHCVYVPLVRERKFLIFRLNPETGKLSLADRIDLVAQPYQLCIDPQQRYLYQQLRDDGYSAVASFRIDPSTGGVTPIGEVELEADAYYVAYRQHRAIPAGRLSDSGDGHGTSDRGRRGCLWTADGSISA